MARPSVAPVDRDPGMVKAWGLRGRNWFLGGVNSLLRKDVFHEMPVGTEEGNLEKSAEFYEYKRRLPNLLNELKLIEIEMYAAGVDYFNEVKKIYGEIGPYTNIPVPRKLNSKGEIEELDTASYERKLLDSGTGFATEYGTGKSIEWDYGTHHSLKFKDNNSQNSDPANIWTPDEVRKMYGLDVWDLPILFPGEKEPRVYYFPLPMGRPVVFDKGHIEIVRYWGRKSISRINDIYSSLLAEIQNDVDKWAQKNKDNIAKDATGKTDNMRFGEQLKSCVIKLQEVIDDIGHEITQREDKFRGALEPFASGNYGTRLKQLYSEIIKKSPATKGNVKRPRTFHVVKTVYVPQYIDGMELELDNEWMGHWEEWRRDWLQGKQPKDYSGNKYHVNNDGVNDHSPQVRKKEFVPERLVAGYYLPDEKAGTMKLITLKETGFNKLSHEIDWGLDECGMPLEVDASGNVMIDEWEKRLVKRKVRKEFTQELPVIDVVNIVHNEWDSYRDELRDARYHETNPTAIEYAMVRNMLNRDEWETYRDPEKPSTKLGRRRIKDIGPGTRGYRMKMEGGSNAIWPDKRSSSNLSPALDLNGINKPWHHPGRDWWHGWPEDVNKKLVGNRKTDPPEDYEAIVTTRGLSMYLIDRVNSRMKFIQDIDTTLQRFEQFDYGPRIFKSDFAKSPHALSNLAQLNNPPLE